MAAKRVMGNDPFKRGAAPRVPVATKPVVAGKASRPPTPELQTATQTSGPKKAPSAHHAVGADPIRHSETPVASALGKPQPHPGSPSPSADPVRHDHSPSAVSLVSGPAPHPQSPSPSADPIAHPSAPTGTLVTGPQAHPGSPSVTGDAVPHAQSPSVVVEPPRPPPSAEPPSAHPITRPPTAPLFSSDGALTSAKGVAAAVSTMLGRSPKDAEVDGYGRDESLVRALQPLADALYERYWRVTVEGAARLPKGPSILVANHAGVLPIDGPLLHHALTRERPDLPKARWLLEDQVFHAPAVGVLWNRLGAVRASPENALQLLASGAPVIVFPEGFQGLSKPFSERYQLQRFGRGGYVKIAARAGVPIVPVAIVGAEESVPLIAKLPGAPFGMPFLPLTLPPLPARWFIRFGEPVLVPGGAASAQDPELVLQLNTRVRETIEGMLRELLAQRPGVF